jgi:hypothetical protein
MNMTRETKVGLVVCCSFLGLVAVVLVMKLRGEPNDAEEAVAEETIPEPPKPVASIPPAAGSLIPAKASEANGPQVIPVGAVSTAQPLPPPSQTQAPLALPAVAATEKTQQAGIPLTPPPAPAQGQVNGLTGDFVNAIEPELMGPPPPTEEDIAATRLMEQPHEFVGPLPPTLAELAALPSPGPGQEPRPEVNNARVPVAPEVAPPASTDTAGQRGSPLAPPPSASDVRDLSGRQDSVAVASQGTNQMPKTDKIELTVPPPPPAQTTAPTVGLLPPAPPPSAIGGALVRGNTGGTMNTQTIVPVSGTENLRPVGAMPTASTPPIAVPSPSNAPAPRPALPTTPQVESYDEELYRAKRDDTFEKISRDHFNTDKYAEAIKRWNMSHPQASDKMRADPPQLDAGQIVFIPPAYMLEKRHGKLIPGWKPNADPEPSRTANASPSTAQNFKWYAVPERGQNIRDIARATLNDPDRSGDIVKLNPTIKPEYLIPGGQLIKLPADARVETTANPR